MQRNQPERAPHPRRGAERDAMQPMASQPRSDEEESELQEPDRVPSMLTARELQARPPRGDDRARDAGERHASASFDGSRGEPPVTEEEPARGTRGLPEQQQDEMAKGRKRGGK